MRTAAVTLLVLLLTGIAPAAAAPPSASCPGATATTDTFATAGPGGLYWLENMGFDGRGGMWVSELALNRVVRYDAQGKPGAAVAVRNPGATILGSDGRMYAMFGDGLTGDAGVVRFDPTAAAPAATPFAGGLEMANGAAFDAAGNLYVADTINGLVAKVGRDGAVEADWLAAPGADGIVRIGDTLYVTEFSDPRSTILAVPVADPRRAAPAAQLSDDMAGAKFLDDLDVGPDGRLYVASNRGELIRVDPADGSACILVAGLPMVDSVRFAKAFAPFGDRDLFMTSQTGVIIHARISETGAAVVAKPRIRLRVRPRHVHAGRRVRLRVRVTSSAPCRAGVRIRGVTTGPRGRARVRLRFAHRGRHVIVARKAGCRPGRAVVRAR